MEIPELSLLSRSAWALAALLLLTCSTAAFAQFNASDRTFHVPRIDAITIDGDDGDWKDHGLLVYPLLDERGDIPDPEDFSVRLRLGWDSRGLLCLVTVVDDIILENDQDRYLFEKDSVELFLGDAQEREVNYYMTVIAPGMDQLHQVPRTYFFDCRQAARATGESSALKAIVRRSAIPGGYQIEALLPWENLNLEPQAGQVCKFQFYAMDADGDGSLYSAVWYPRHNTHLNMTQSMWQLLLSDSAPQPIVATVRIDGLRVRVIADPSLSGEEVIVRHGDEAVQRGSLRQDHELAIEELWLDNKTFGNTAQSIQVEIAGQPVFAGSIGGAAACLASAMEICQLGFDQYVFTTNEFPKPHVANPIAVEALIGPFVLNARYFDDAFNEVSAPEENGRYGAIVELAPHHGRTSRRFFTLYRAAGSDTALPLPAISLPGGLMFQTGDYVDEAEARLRCINSSESAHTPSQDAEAALADKQWWIGLKRRLYAMEARYGSPDFGPEQLAQAGAPPLREGSAAEAGVEEGLVTEIDRICRTWSDARRRKGHGFSLCIARKGVIFFHQAFGSAADDGPMTVDTPCRLASTTKIFAGALTMMFVDRGLVSLDAPLDQYLPTLTEALRDKPLTLRHLFTHTSGIPGNYGDDLNDLEERIADVYRTLDSPVYHNYGGTGYALAIKALEMVSGTPLQVMAKEHLLGPLGCSDAAAMDDSHRGARGTVSDLAALGQMLVNGGTYGQYRFFGEETWQAMKPHRLTSILGEETDKQWGIGMWYWPNEPHGFSDSQFGHPANSAYLWVDPRRQLVIAYTATQKKMGFYEMACGAEVLAAIDAWLPVSESGD
jgi:CubicO group peptidase (beta-lactamase class C family)